MKTIKEILSEWKKECKISEGIAAHLDGNNLYIVTRFPGVMIGYHGTTIEKYKEIFQNQGYDINIQFIDIFCGDAKMF